MSQPLPKVLVVDDSKEITDLIRSYCLHYEGEFVTIVTNKPEHVLRILEENDDIRLIVTDFRMPVIDGLELIIRVKERYPALEFVMMTGYGSPRLRQQVEERGVVRYLEKPFKINELVDIIRQVLLRTGFEGFVPSLQLADIIQLVALSSGDAALEISAGERAGRVYFRAGNVIHAECGAITGAEAFYELFRWRSGRFIVSHLLPDVPQTISESWQGLVLEAARREDELALSESGNADEYLSKPESTPVEDDLSITSLREAAAKQRPDEIVPVAENGGAAKPVPVIDNAQEMATKALAPVPGLRFLDEMKRARPEAAASASPSPVRGDVSLDAIERIVPRVVGHYLYLFPEADQPVTIGRLRISELTPVLRRHLMFHFHMVSTTAFRFEDAPFNFSDPRVAKAAFSFLETLLETWEVSRDQFSSMIEQAVRFHLARALAPATALAEFLSGNGEGRAGRMQTILSSMLSRGVVERLYEPLAGFLEARRNSELQAGELEATAANILRAAEPAVRREEIHNSAIAILEIVGIATEHTPRTLERRVAVTMLHARGLNDALDNLLLAVTEDASPVTPETLTSLL